MRRIAALLLVFLMVFLAKQVIGQQDPLFTQYAYNKLAINPAYAGSAGRFNADLITRFQWAGIEGAPRTFSLTAHAPIRNRHVGLGIYAYSDQLGPSVDYGAMAAFSYRIPFRTTTLCFGIQGGFKYMDINWAILTPKEPGDLLLTGQVKNRAVPDFDVGTYYYGSRFYAGFSAKHLFQNQIVVSSAAPDDATSFTKLRRNYYLMAGGAVPCTSGLDFLPSVLIKYVTGAPVQADLNASFLIANTLTLGASWRTEEALALIAVVNIGKGFSVGYSYDIWFNALRSYNSGSHEIRLGYEVDLFRRERMLTPRFF